MFHLYNYHHKNKKQSNKKENSRVSRLKGDSIVLHESALHQDMVVLGWKVKRELQCSSDLLLGPAVSSK